MYNYERLELMNIQKSLRNLDGKRFWILLDLFEKVPFQIQEYLGRGGNAAPLWSERAFTSIEGRRVETVGEEGPSSASPERPPTSFKARKLVFTSWLK